MTSKMECLRKICPKAPPRRSKTPPRRSKTAQDPPRTSPRPPKTLLRYGEIDQKSAQEAPQRRPRWLKTARDEPKTLQDAFQSHQDRENKPKMNPKAFPS